MSRITVGRRNPRSLPPVPFMCQDICIGSIDLCCTGVPAQEAVEPEAMQMLQGALVALAEENVLLQQRWVSRRPLVTSGPDAVSLSQGVSTRTYCSSSRAGTSKYHCCQHPPRVSACA